MIDFDALVVGPVIRIFGSQPGDDVRIWYRPPGQQALRVAGVFDEAARELTISADGEQITDVRPILGIRLGDLTAKGIAPNQGDKVTIRRRDGSMADFQVANVDPDGQGGAKLTLNQLVTPA